MFDIASTHHGSLSSDLYHVNAL